MTEMHDSNPETLGSGRAGCTAAADSAVWRAQGETPLDSALALKGITRRSFLEFCGAVAVAAGLSELAAPRIACALEDKVIGATEGNLYPVVWLEGASCTGCTESFAQLESPDVASVLLELLSLNFSDTFSAAAGNSAELAKTQTIEAGNYLLVFEGAVAQAWDGEACRCCNTADGTDSQTCISQLEEAAANAKSVVALGSCAVNGGWMGARPVQQIVDACGVEAYLRKAGFDVPVINVPGCPANPEWLMSVLIEVLMLDGAGLALTRENKPAGIFSQTVHDNCERRGHFENGEFVYRFGSEEEALGYCLYPMGCRGPMTHANCGVTLWNNRRSWCVQAGGPCVGCCEADPSDPGHNWVEVNTPFHELHRDVRIGDTPVQPTAIAGTITAVAAAALAAHGFGMKAAGRMDGGADFEPVRAWDAKHPDKAIGDYSRAIDPTAARAALEAHNAPSPSPGQHAEDRGGRTGNAAGHEPANGKGGRS